MNTLLTEPGMSSTCFKCKAVDQTTIWIVSLPFAYGGREKHQSIYLCAKCAMEFLIKHGHEFSYNVKAPDKQEPEHDVRMIKALEDMVPDAEPAVTYGVDEEGNEVSFVRVP